MAFPGAVFNLTPELISEIVDYLRARSDPYNLAHFLSMQNVRFVISAIPNAAPVPSPAYSFTSESPAHLPQPTIGAKRPHADPPASPDPIEMEQKTEWWDDPTHSVDLVTPTARWSDSWNNVLPTEPTMGSKEVLLNAVDLRGDSAGRGKKRNKKQKVSEQASTSKGKKKLKQRQSVEEKIVRYAKAPHPLTYTHTHTLTLGSGMQAQPSLT